MRRSGRLAWGLGAAAALATFRFARYTEIDWKAYMSEVEGPVVRGDWDYDHLEGATGPLVYPAGFVYIFAGLRAVTDAGRDIAFAQLIFTGLHVLVMGLVLASVYSYSNSTPQWAVPLAMLSRRTHSIFSLRLFNDGVAMFFAYACVLASCGDCRDFSERNFQLTVHSCKNTLPRSNDRLRYPAAFT